VNIQKQECPFAPNGLAISAGFFCNPNLKAASVEVAAATRKQKKPHRLERSGGASEWF
jgi:hypothetical protein